MPPFRHSSNCLHEALCDLSVEGWRRTGQRVFLLNAGKMATSIQLQSRTSVQLHARRVLECLSVLPSATRVTANIVRIVASFPQWAEGRANLQRLQPATPRVGRDVF